MSCMRMPRQPEKTMEIQSSQKVYWTSAVFVGMTSPNLRAGALQLFFFRKIAL